MSLRILRDNVQTAEVALEEARNAAGILYDRAATLEASADFLIEAAEDDVDTARSDLQNAERRLIRRATKRTPLEEMILR